MPTTPLNGFPYPALSDAPNVPLHIGNLAGAVDTRMPRGLLCNPVLVGGNVGTGGGYVAVATSPTITIPAGRSIEIKVLTQMYFVGATGQRLYVAIERWASGVLQGSFGARGYDITYTPQLLDVVLNAIDEPAAGSYQYKVAASISGSPTNAYVDSTSVPTGRVRSNSLTITDVGPVPAI